LNELNNSLLQVKGNLWDPKFFCAMIQLGLVIVQYVALKAT